MSRAKGIRFLGIVFFGGMVWSFLSAGTVCGETIRETQWRAVLEQLDSPSYRDREQAQEMARRMLLETLEPGIFLRILQDEISRKGISFEKQYQLKKLRRLRPEDTLSAKQESKVSWEDTISYLVGEDYARRVQAEEEILRGASEEKELGNLLIFLRKKLTLESLGVDDRHRLERLEKKIRYFWLASEMREIYWTQAELERDFQILSETVLSEALLKSLAEWKEKIHRPYLLSPGENAWGEFSLSGLPEDAGEQKEWLRCWESLRRLEDAFSHPSSSAWVEETLKTQETACENPGGRIFLQRLGALRQSCVAAEYWQLGVQETFQFLAVGIPQQIPGENRSTCFSELTETTIHCDRGYNLSQGTLPLEKAILHPRQNALFCMRGLGTPHAQLLYFSQLSEASYQRWKRITQQTLTNWDGLGDEKYSSENLFRLWRQLEPRELSLWMGEKLCRSDADPFWSSFWGGRNEWCWYLGRYGTKEAIPFLLKAMESKEIREVDGFLAVLGITRRERWEGMEKWLRMQIARIEPLFPEEKKRSPMQASPSPNNRNLLELPTESRWEGMQPPQWGATAAGVWCRCCGVEPETCGLKIVPQGGEKEIPVAYYRQETTSLPLPPWKESATEKNPPL